MRVITGNRRLRFIVAAWFAMVALTVVGIAIASSREDRPPDAAQQVKRQPEPHTSAIRVPRAIDVPAWHVDQPASTSQATRSSPTTRKPSTSTGDQQPQRVTTIEIG